MIDFETGIVIAIVLGVLANIVLVMILDARITKMESRLRNKYRS